jgi:hypothetical protein
MSDDRNEPEPEDTDYSADPRWRGNAVGWVLVICFVALLAWVVIEYRRF